MKTPLREQGAYIRKVFRVYIAVGVQVGIVTCVAEEDDQENIVKMRVLSAMVIGVARRRRGQRPALAGGSCWRRQNIRGKNRTF